MGQTDLFTAKKALYLLLMFQMALYLLYTIIAVDWSMLLVVIAGYYLDAKKRNFMLMYLVIVSVTVLLDVIKIAAMPNIALRRCHVLVRAHGRVAVVGTLRGIRAAKTLSTGCSCRCVCPRMRLFCTGVWCRVA